MKCVTMQIIKLDMFMNTVCVQIYVSPREREIECFNKSITCNNVVQFVLFSIDFFMYQYINAVYSTSFPCIEL